MVQKYLVEKKTFKEIAKEYGCSSSTAENWAKKYGIKARPSACQGNNGKARRPLYTISCFRCVHGCATGCFAVPLEERFWVTEVSSKIVKITKSVNKELRFVTACDRFKYGRAPFNRQSPMKKAREDMRTDINGKTIKKEVADAHISC